MKLKRLGSGAKETALDGHLQPPLQSESIKTLSTATLFLSSRPRKSDEQFRKSLEADKMHSDVLVSPRVFDKVHPGFANHES